MAEETVVAIIENITQSFADNGYQGITEINATDTASVTFTYDDRIRVKLGIPEDLDYKVRTAMTIINENLEKNQANPIKGILDVSRCNTTKRSYFNEQEINPTVAPSQNPSETATEAYSGDYSEDENSWYDDSYYENSNSYYGDDWSFYSDDGGYYYGEW